MFAILCANCPSNDDIKTFYCTWSLKVEIVITFADVFAMLQAGGRPASDAAHCSQTGAAGVRAAAGGSTAQSEWTDAQQLPEQRHLPPPHGQWIQLHLPDAQTPFIQY